MVRDASGVLSCLFPGKTLETGVGVVPTKSWVLRPSASGPIVTRSSMRPDNSNTRKIALHELTLNLDLRTC